MATKRRLKSMGDVRRYLADVAVRMDKGTLDPVVGGKIAYCCNILRACIVEGEVERRLDQLENDLAAEGEEVTLQ